MKICVLPLLCMALSVVLAVKGFFISIGEHPTSAQYQCIKQSSYNFTFINMFVTDSDGTIFPEAVSQLTSAKSAGFILDIIILPNRSRGAAAQVNNVMATIPSSLYGKIWIRFHDWSNFTAESNCAYL
jgi:hypothetical protein